MLYLCMILKFICIVLMHIQLEGEVQQGIYFMNYVIYADDIDDDYKWQIIGIALMQMSGAVLTEFINLFNIYKKWSYEDIITNFIAYGVIAEVDDYFAGTIKKRILKQSAFDDASYKIHEDKNHSEGLRALLMTPSKLIYYTLERFYRCVYYYFLPFIALILSMFAFLS
jgi:hypothetical protein